MTEHQAWERLQTLVPTGLLRIITTEPDPEGAHYPKRDPRHWVCHTVVRLERFGLVSEGRVRAYAKEGDMCDGVPLALLRRLMRHEQAIRMDGGRTRAAVDVRPGNVIIQAQTAQASALTVAG